MIKKIIAFLMVVPSFSWAQERNSQVKSWHETIPEKGYILSIDLYQNQKCSEIWTKQVPLFQEKNPQIADPDKIDIGQKILVQSCFTPPEPVVEKLPPKESPSKYYIEIFGGYSYFGKESSDTEKDGYNYGAKIGRYLGSNNQWFIDLGYQVNHLETKDLNSTLGAYEIDSQYTLLDVGYQWVGEHWRFGPVLTAVYGKDISFNEQELDKKWGAFGGLNLRYSFNRRWDLGVTVEQQIDNVSRTNLISNLGLRINF